MATLLNFLNFLQLDFPHIQTTKILKHTTDYMQRQRLKKEKRSGLYKEKSHRKLEGVEFPPKAIITYEKKCNAEVTLTLNKEFGSLKQSAVETLCSDIFLKIICKLGCRLGCLIEMTKKEIADAERTKKGNWSTLIDKQKQKKRPGCVIVSNDKLKQMHKVSLHADTFSHKNANQDDPVFPNIIEDSQKLFNSKSLVS